MPSIIIIDKTGKIKDQNVKDVQESELYKKANFKSAEGFKRQNAWSITYKDKKYTIVLYAKTNGKAGQENKYEFPPPVDTILYFGSCVIVNYEGDTVVDIKKDDWEKVYEYLMGGFSDTNEDLSDEEEEEDYEGQIGADGYLRDGFIADDDNNEDEVYLEDEEDSSSEEESVEIKRKKGSSSKKKSSSLDKKKETKPEQVEYYLDCQSELEEEAYIV